MQLFTNNAASVLNGAIDAAALSLTLKTGEGALFPAPTGGDFFLVTLYQKAGATEINHEIVKCTARAGDVLTVVRGQEGTTARAFSNADPVELRLTAKAAQVAVAGAPVVISSTYTYNADGTVATAPEVTSAGTRTNAFTYNTDGTVATVVSVLAGVTRTETYTYNADGAVASMTAT